jgi:hypothetical protein
MLVGRVCMFTKNTTVHYGQEADSDVVSEGVRGSSLKCNPQTIVRMFKLIQWLKTA